MRLYAYFKNCAVIIKQSFLGQIFLGLSCATVEAMDDKWYPIQNVYGKDTPLQLTRPHFDLGDWVEIWGENILRVLL